MKRKTRAKTRQRNAKIKQWGTSPQALLFVALLVALATILVGTWYMDEYFCDHASATVAIAEGCNR